MKKEGNCQNNKAREGFRWKISILVALFSILFCMSFASAILTTATYSSDKKTVEVNDFMGLGTKIAKITLNAEVDKINYVPVGKDVVVWSFTIEQYWDEFANPISNLKIINMKTGLEVSKSFRWVYAVYGEVDTFELFSDCKEVEDNKTKKMVEQCTSGYKPKKEIGIVEWKDYDDKAIMPKGKITIGLMTDVNAGDYYDGIPTLFEKEITSWTSWSASVLDIGYPIQDALYAINNYYGQRIKSKCGGGKKLRIVEFGIASGTGGSTNKGCHVVENTTGVDGTPDTTLGDGVLSQGDTRCVLNGGGTEINDAQTVTLIINATNGAGGFTVVMGAGGGQYGAYPVTNGTNVDWTGSCVDQPAETTACSNNCPAGNCGYWVMITNVTTQCESSAVYPTFSNYWDNNGTLSDAKLNVTVAETNGSVYLNFNNVNYTATNSSGDPTVFNVTITGLGLGTVYYNWTAYSSTAFNISQTRDFTTTADTTPPSFTNWENQTLPKEKFISKTHGYNLSIVEGTAGGDTYGVVVQNNASTWSLGSYQIGNSSIVDSCYAIGDGVQYQGTLVEHTCSFTPAPSFQRYSEVSLELNRTAGAQSRTRIDSTFPISDGDLVFIHSKEGAGTSLANIFYVENVSMRTNEYTYKLSYNLTISEAGTFNINWTDTFSITPSGELTNISSLIPNGEYWINISANDTYNNMNSSILHLLMNWTSNIPVLNTNSPVDDLNTTTNSITFNCNATDDFGILNMSIWINGIRNYTEFNTTAFENMTLNPTLTVGDGDYYWRCSASDKEHSVYGGYRNLSIDTNYPTTTLYNLTNIYTTVLPASSIWNFTATDSHLSSCWYNTSENSTVQYLICNTASLQTDWTSEGWKTINYCANDTFGWQTCSAKVIRIGYFNSSHIISKDPVGEGESILFTLYVNQTNINAEYPLTNATFYLNSIAYIPTATDTSASDYVKFTRTIIADSSMVNATGKNDNEYNWTFTIQNTTTNYSSLTDTKTFTGYGVNVSDCGVTSGKIILNLSLKDEELNSLLTGSTNTSIELDLTISSWLNLSQLWNFHKTWLNKSSVAVCVPDTFLNYSSYKIEFTSGYEASNHVVEFYYLDNGTLNSTNYFNHYTNRSVDLMDLASADSTTFLFTYTDEDGLEVDDIIVHTFRKYIGDGIFREVERSRQDTNGQTHVHLVEEDVIYYFMITQYGNILYTSGTYNAKCLSTPCTIDLSAQSESFDWSSIDNDWENYHITGSKATRTISLNFSLESSSFVNFSLYTYNNNIPTFVNGTTRTASSGLITLTAPITYGNGTYLAVVYTNGRYSAHEFLDLSLEGKDYFGTLGALLGGIIVLALLLMAVTEGIAFIVVAIIGVIAITVMKLVNFDWMIIISLVCMGGVIIFKLMKRRQQN